MTAATAHMREIVQALLHSGFSVITMSQNHPLREWLASEVVVDDPHTRPQPVQLEFPQPQSGKRGEPAKAFTAEQLSLF